MTDLCIIAIKYEEPEYQQTVDCIKSAGYPFIFIDRKPSGIGSLAEAINRGVNFGKEQGKDFRYFWIITNITFTPDVPAKLLQTIKEHKAAAVHPQFASDHKHIREGQGVKSVPFVEFTAAMIDIEQWQPLDEKMPYWGHDLDHGYRVNQAGGTILVDHTVTIDHVYIRNAKRHPITMKRLEMRRATDRLTSERLKEKYGAKWREIMYAKTEKQIGHFYKQATAEIVKTSARIIAVDLDGVLTDGKFIIDHKGNVSKSFSSLDLAGIKELIAYGYEVHIVTASSWPGADSYIRKTGAVLHVIRDKSELPVKPDIAIGDSAWDIPMLRTAGAAYCPADAVKEVKELPGVVTLETAGGGGVMLEVARILCR